MELLDKSLLRLLKHRDKYDRYINSVPLDLVDKHAKTILLDYGRFFIETEADTATAKEFVPWMMLAHPKLNDTAKATLSSIIQEVQEDSPEGVERGLLRRLEEHKQVARMTNLIERYGAGDEVDVLATVQDMADRMPVLKNASAFVPVDVDGILDEQLNDVGFHWRLQCLNNSMRPLAGGDFLIYAARVDQGKSSFMASEASWFAPQVDKLFPGQDRSIIVLNNEGPGRRLNSRLMCATMEASVEKLVEQRKAGVDVWRTVLDKWGGRQVVKVFDVHDMPISRLEEIVRRENPAMVFVDMLDNVPFDGTVNNGGQRTDQVLEALYQRARIWAVKYDCVVLASSQLNAEAEDVMYPGLAMLANSRTGKPGAADAIIMLGSMSDFPSMRYISLPKNKLAKAGGKKDPRETVRFKGAEALFLDAETVKEQ